jgi:hypothetical protein
MLAGRCCCCCCCCGGCRGWWSNQNAVSSVDGGAAGWPAAVDLVGESVRDSSTEAINTVLFASSRARQHFRPVVSVFAPAPRHLPR